MFADNKNFSELGVKEPHSQANVGGWRVLSSSDSPYRKQRSAATWRHPKLRQAGQPVGPVFTAPFHGRSFPPIRCRGGRPGCEQLPANAPAARVFPVVTVMHGNDADQGRTQH